MGKVDLFMLMEMSMKDNGLITNAMALECTLIQMELLIKVCGRKTNNMGVE